MSESKMHLRILYAILFALVIAAICVFSLLFIPNKTVNFWTCFVATIVGVLSIGISTLLSKGYEKHVSLNYAFIYVSWIYFILNIIASIIFVFIVPLNSSTWCVFTQIILFIIFLVVMIGLAISRRTVFDNECESDKKYFALNEQILAVQSIVKLIELSNVPNKDNVLEEVKKLEHALTYSDPVESETSESIDLEIRQGINNLKSDIIVNIKEQSFNEVILLQNFKKIHLLINERNKIVKLNK